MSFFVNKEERALSDWLNLNCHLQIQRVRIYGEFVSQARLERSVPGFSSVLLPTFIEFVEYLFFYICPKTPEKYFVTVEDRNFEQSTYIK